MSENPVISNPEEGDNTLYSGVSGNKSPGNGTKERRISVEKKIELKNSSPESKNSKEKEKDNDYSATQLRRPSKECGQVEGVLDETVRASPDKASKVSEEKQLDEKPSEMTEAEEISEINQTSSTVSGCRSENSELGIVGPATAAENILHDDELLDPAKDQAETVAEWMERSSLQKSKTTLKNKNNTKELSGQGATTTTRKSQRIVSSIIKRSIKCLNKMHAMECASSPGNKTVNDKKDDTTGDSPKVPQSRQNGAALPEETATATSVTTGRVKVERIQNSLVKKERQSDDEDCSQVKKKSRVLPSKETRKRRSTDETNFSTNGNPKRICFEQRERFIDSLVGCDRISAEELATRADELRAEVQALDELARAKEMEWNEILSMRKLKEEAYLRVERKRQVMGFLENNNGQMSDSLPPASLSLMSEWSESHREASQERRAQETPSASDVTHEERVNSRLRVEVGRENLQGTEDEIPLAISKGDDEVANLSQKSSRNASGVSSKHQHHNNSLLTDES
ncbi:GSCOCG00007806001-RA-CDS [Cotesia congregata]|nr:GSCOCG00007806001-RA-CDS [Cotesia congregata]